MEHGKGGNIADDRTTLSPVEPGMPRWRRRLAPRRLFPAFEWLPGTAVGPSSVRAAEALLMPEDIRLESCESMPMSSAEENEVVLEDR